MINYVNNLFVLWQLILVGAFLNGQEIIEKPIVVLTTSYNNRNYVKQNIESICVQDYSNYRVIYIDDCSSDGTAELVNFCINKLGKASKFNFIKNKFRLGSLENVYTAVNNCSDEEIIVSLDGDDWFFDNQVLKKINNAYSTKDIWLTHGTLVEFPKGVIGWSIPIPEEIIINNAFRQYRCPSHLKTFYAWLFKKIKIEDLKYENEFFKMTGDQAMIFPMLEMAGERHFFINDIIYVYNMQNPINDNKVNAQLQRDLEAHIRAKKPYERLKEGPVF